MGCLIMVSAKFTTFLLSLAWEPHPSTSFPLFTQLMKLFPLLVRQVIGRKLSKVLTTLPEYLPSQRASPAPVHSQPLYIKYISLYIKYTLVFNIFKIYIKYHTHTLHILWPLCFFLRYPD